MCPAASAYVGQLTSSDAGSVHAVGPVGAIARVRTRTVVAGVRPVIVVFACVVGVVVTHVLPPSVLYSHSWDARLSVPTFAVTSTDPEVEACFTFTSFFERTEGLRSSRPALPTIAAAVPGLAFATAST